MEREQAEKKLIAFLLEREGHRLRSCGVCGTWYVLGVDTENKSFCGDGCKREAELARKRSWWNKNYKAHVKSCACDFCAAR
jgi:hypothetical protein